MASPETEIRNHRLALALIIASVVLHLAFDLIDGNGPRVEWFAWTGHDFTPPTKDWDGELFVVTIIYHGCAHLSLICLLVAAYLSPTRKIFKIMAWFEFFDLLDYAITYNSAYVVLDKISPYISIPVEFGLFKAVGIILFTVREFNGSRAATIR